MISIFPTTESSDSIKQLVPIHLVHPRSNRPARFLLNESNRALMETQTVTRGCQSNGSFLIHPNKLVHKTELRIHNAVDPFFLILGPLLSAAPPTGSFIDYIDCMNMMIEKTTDQRCNDGMVRLLQCMNKSPNFKDVLLSNFCDFRTVLDRVLLRMDKSKIINWLTSKVDLAERLLASEDVYIVEVASNPAENARIVALELIRSYIPEELYKDLSEALSMNTDSLFGEIESPAAFQAENHKPGNGSADTKKRQSVASSQPTAKKMKEIAVAKTCMKMTSFFKPKQ